MEEFEEAVCVCFHKDTFGQATDGGLRQGQKAADCAECGVPYPERAEPKQATSAAVTNRAVRSARSVRNSRPMVRLSRPVAGVRGHGVGSCHACWAAGLRMVRYAAFIPV
jgi:hypothetical protein